MWFGSSLQPTFSMVLDEQRHERLHLVSFGLCHVFFLILRVDGQQENRKHFVVEIIDYSHAATFPPPLSCPAKFPNTARLGNNLASVRVGANKSYQLLPFTLCQ